MKMLNIKLSLETKYSLYQSNKILQFMNEHLSYDDLLNKNEYSSILVRDFYKEKTNVFAYYIIKTIMLFYYQDTILWFSINNINLYQFANSKQHILSFIQYIINKSTKQEFIDNMHIMQLLYNELGRNTGNTKADKWLNESLTMTIYG